MRCRINQSFMTKSRVRPQSLLTFLMEARLHSMSKDGKSKDSCYARYTESGCKTTILYHIGN